MIQSICIWTILVSPLVKFMFSVVETYENGEKRHVKIIADVILLGLIYLTYYLANLFSLV